MSACEAFQAAHSISSWEDLTDAQCKVNFSHIVTLGRLRGLNQGMKRMPDEKTNLQA